jgi:hypothetical protein
MSPLDREGLARATTGDGADRILFHYTSLAGLLEILRTAELWATEIHRFSDSRELAHSFGAASQILRGDGNPDPVVRGRIAALLSSLESFASVNMYVACLSEDGDSLSQWRAYCPAGRGVAIGFSASVLQRILSPCGFRLARCRYTADDLLAASRAYLEAALLAAEPFSAGSVVAGYLQLACVFKHPAFAEEKEWRAVSCAPIGCDDPRLRFRETRNTVAPYIPLPLLTDEGHLPIRELVVGPTPEPALTIDALSMAMYGKTDGQHSIRPSQVPYRTW